MRRWWRLAAGLALFAGACADTAQERVRDYNEDGVYLYQRGEFARAGESFRAALELTPEDAGLLYNLAQCHDRLGDAAKAEQLYQECLKRDPDHAACRHSLTLLLARTGRRDEAARSVGEWLAKEPKRSAPYAADGWLLHQAGDLPRAQARLQQALDIDPHDVQALNELALIYEEMQRPERALVLYERALAQDARQPDVAKRVSRLRSQGVGPPRPD